MEQCVRVALAEDLGVKSSGSDSLRADADWTSRASVPADRRASAEILARAPGRLAGLAAAESAFTLLDSSVAIQCVMRDGDDVAPGDLVMRVEGQARAILAAERTALNFLQRLSGVATQTARFVAAVAGTSARILDTRKTTPGLRTLEKAAVVSGGGENHRIGLFDQILLKENHFALGGGSYAEVVARCVAESSVPVVAEARDLDEARAAARGGAAVVLLDNFAPGPDLREAIAAVRDGAGGRPIEVEASGGVRLETVRSFAECGVDRISIGALTHSAQALDLSLLVTADAGVES